MTRFSQGAVRPPPTLREPSQLPAAPSLTGSSSPFTAWSRLHCMDAFRQQFRITCEAHCEEQKRGIGICQAEMALILFLPVVTNFYDQFRLIKKSSM